MAENRYIKKSILILLSLFFYFVLPVSGQTPVPSYFQMANYRTAQRCLELARTAVIQLNYEESYSLVLTGLEYDTSIPDLWYLKALLLSFQGGPKYQIREAVEQSLQAGQWLYYTPEAARILNAQVLVKTGEEKKALDVLNSKPFILTSDAEYIRAQAYYKLSDAKKAREIVANARKSYPKDTRFPLLFFTKERFTYNEGDAYYKELLQSLLNMTDSWKDTDSDILLFASYFIQGSQKERYLKEYKRAVNKNPLFIAAFLEAGILSELEAVSTLFSYAESQISGSVFFEVLSLIKSKEAFLEAASKLESFSGTLLFDKTGDGEDDFSAAYLWGRPSAISYDENADGLENWYSELDYGVPVKISCYDNNFELYYGRYPYIDTAVSTDTMNPMEIQLVDGSVDWKPFTMELIPIIGNLVFYLPSLEQQTEFIPLNLFLQNASEIVVRGGSSNDTVIRFSMRDSLPKTAVYTQNDKPYAYGFFEDGLLVFRNVDNDGNGSYEVSEMYAFDPGVSSLYLNETQSSSMYKNLFGSLSANEGLFVTKIVADTNDNALIDFMEEYLNDGSIKTSWDSDEDGVWDVIYEKKNTVDKGLEETVSFLHPLDTSLVLIKFENREPVSVFIGKEQISITKLTDLPFYWLGPVPDSSYALRALNALQKENVQGLRILVPPDKDSKGLVLAIKVNNLFFGEFINE